MKLFIKSGRKQKTIKELETFKEVEEEIRKFCKEHKVGKFKIKIEGKGFLKDVDKNSLSALFG